MASFNRACLSFDKNYSAQTQEFCIPVSRFHFSSFIQCSKRLAYFAESTFYMPLVVLETASVKKTLTLTVMLIHACE